MVLQGVVPIIAPNMSLQPENETVKATIQHCGNDFDIGTVETMYLLFS